jgi:Mrp family chromosome partitioning ATPase
VLIAGCRIGDGASTVAGALALDLSWRLGIETLLVDAGRSGGPLGAEAGLGSSGRPLRIKPGGVARLWTTRCANRAEAARPALPAGNGQAETDELVAELQAVAARYRAAVIDLGVVRLDARMLALARPDDPVLIVARYGCTRREELISTAAILGLAKCRIGGVILNASESPATDRIARLRGFGNGHPGNGRSGDGCSGDD